MYFLSFSRFWLHTDQQGISQGGLPWSVDRFPPDLCVGRLVHHPRHLHLHRRRGGPHRLPVQQGANLGLPGAQRARARHPPTHKHTCPFSWPKQGRRGPCGCNGTGTSLLTSVSPAPPQSHLSNPCGPKTEAGRSRQREAGGWTGERERGHPARIRAAPLPRKSRGQGKGKTPGPAQLAFRRPPVSGTSSVLPGKRWELLSQTGRGTGLVDP